MEDSPVSADQLGGIITLIKDGTISGKIAKDLFEIVWNEGGDPAKIVEERGMAQVTDTGAIEAAVDEILAANPDKVQQAIEKPNMIGCVTNTFSSRHLEIHRPHPGIRTCLIIALIVRKRSACGCRLTRLVKRKA